MGHGLIGSQKGRNDKKEAQIVLISLACELRKIESGQIGMKNGK